MCLFFGVFVVLGEFFFYKKIGHFSLTRFLENNIYLGSEEHEENT